MFRKPPNKMDIHIGQRIQVRRKLLGMNEHQLAEAVDISRSRLKRYETGQSAILASTLNDIAQELGVPFGYFFDDFNR